jgi:hypothetical protein
MIYIEVEQTEETLAKVVYQHNFPTHKTFGLGRSVDDLNTTGFLVSQDVKNEVRVNDVLVKYYNKTTNALEIKWQPITMLPDEAAQKRILELEEMIAELGLLVGGEF